MKNAGDILVAGAGPVGLAAALELTRRGFSPRIIDKGSDFTPEAQSRALGVNNRTLQLLGPAGVSEKLLAEGAQMRRVRVINEKGREVFEINFDNAGALYPFMLIVPQGRTERLLAAALKERGVNIEWNTEIVAANGNRHTPVVSLRGPDGEEELRPQMLIGADGANSFVRQNFGFSFDGESYPVEFGLADIDLGVDVDTEEAVIHFKKDGVLARLPMGGRLVRYISPRPDISQALPPDLEIANVVWRSSFHINFRHVEKMQRGSVFLAGDAAHVHSPAGARGMNLGIEDACWLAWAADERRLSEYSDLRLPAVHMVIHQTKQQTDGLLKLNAVARFARDHLAGKLLAIPAFKRAAMKRVTGLDTADPPWLD